MQYHKPNQQGEDSSNTPESALSREREEFASIVSNELRVPVLATIRMLDLFLENVFGKLTAKQREMLKLVADNERDLDRSLTSLVDTYRLQTKTADRETN
jgi:signal transduction histidine kinase